MLLLNWCLAVSKSKGSNMHGTTDSLTYHMIRNLLMQKFVFAETSDIMVIQSMQKIRHSIIPVTKAWWAPVMRKEFPFQGIVIKRCEASLPSLIYMYAAVWVLFWSLKNVSSITYIHIMTLFNHECVVVIWCNVFLERSNYVKYCETLWAPTARLNGVSSLTNLRTALIQRNVTENMSDIIVDSVLGDGLAR